MDYMRGGVLTSVYSQIRFFDWPIAETLSDLDAEKSIVFSKVYIDGGGPFFSNCQWMINDQLLEENFTNF